MTFAATPAAGSAFTSGDTPDAPRSDNPTLLASLSRGLRAIGYTVDGVAGLLGETAHAALDRDQIVPALIATRRATASGDPTATALAAVVGLWLLAVPQPREILDAALPGLGTDGLLELDLVTADDDGRIVAKVDLRPYGWAGSDEAGSGEAGSDEAGSGETGDEYVDDTASTPPGPRTGVRSDRGADLLVASDLAAHQRPGVLRRDHVLGIGQASTTLVQSTIRRPVDRALDLGTGCGIQTFHLLHHAAHVTATDISERALAFTRFNLLLNDEELGLDPEHLEERVSLRLGSMLEPVAGEQFELVVSNPPFVITPRSAGESAEEQFTYRDGGLPGDDIVAGLIRSLPGVLAPGGTAQLLGNWEVRAGAEWSERPRSWIDAVGAAATGGGAAGAAATGQASTAEATPAGEVEPGIDAWFIQREQVSPEQYAETWLQDASEGRDRELYARTYGAYLEDFASRDVAAIGFGMVWLRRPASGRPVLRRFEEITYPIEQPIGPHLGVAVERADWLAGHELSSAHLVVADDVTEERHQRPGAEHPGVILLRQGAGLRRTNLLSTELAGFVSACDGELSVQQLIGALTALLGGGDGFDAGAFGSKLLADVGNLVRDGFLLPS